MRRLTVPLCLAALATTAVALASGGGAAPPPVERLTVSPTGTFMVQARGNGHGHGMSQYGARGAAIAGRSYAQILAFYYPKTALVALAPSQIRVRLSGYGSTVTVAAKPTLAVSGIAGVLPSKGVARYRLVPAGRGLTLQRLLAPKGSTWLTYRAGLPDRSNFHNRDGTSLHLFRASGASTYYWGYLTAVRNGSGLFPVNRLSLENYVAGVVPRESPASWPVQALDAQAVAARTYARYEMEHASKSSTYDLCDSSSCQVYGGAWHDDSHGAFVWRDFPAAARNTAGKVLRYHGSTIFAQFSASNGGWSTNGGQAYLTARSDPYDSTASHDPYLLYSQKQSVAALARYFGLAQLNQIVVTQRDGHGAWGGRVLQAYVEGHNAAHQIVRVPATGFDLQDALGVGTTWLAFRAA